VQEKEERGKIEGEVWNRAVGPTSKPKCVAFKEQTGEWSGRTDGRTSVARHVSYRVLCLVRGRF